MLYRMRRIGLLFAILLPCSIGAVWPATLPCRPCAGLRLESVAPPPVTPGASTLPGSPGSPPSTPGTAASPEGAAGRAAPPLALVPMIAESRLQPGSPLFVAWDVPL
ncbi:MAG: hypothetical protein M3O15_10575, partial [Acidobacteriota bacterium]|nr:hypothetical protein [Acidobacteriota bacterium]